MEALARLIADFERLRAEASAAGVRNPNFERSLEFGYGVIYGQDLAYETIIEHVRETISKEDDEDKEL